MHDNTLYQTISYPNAIKPDKNENNNTIFFTCVLIFSFFDGLLLYSYSFSTGSLLKTLKNTIIASKIFTLAAKYVEPFNPIIPIKRYDERSAPIAAPMVFKLYNLAKVLFLFPIEDKRIDDITGNVIPITEVGSNNSKKFTMIIKDIGELENSAPIFEKFSALIK